MCCFSCKTICILALLAVIVTTIGTAALFAWIKSFSEEALKNSDVAKAINLYNSYTNAPSTIKREVGQAEIALWDGFNILKFFDEEKKE